MAIRRRPRLPGGTCAASVQGRRHRGRARYALPDSGSRSYVPDMRLWIGATTFLVGAALWFAVGGRFGAPEGRGGPTWLPRLGLALGALGLSVLASTRPGLSWAISSICFSIVAIVLLAWVLRDNLRR